MLQTAFRLKLILVCLILVIRRLTIMSTFLLISSPLTESQSEATSSPVELVLHCLFFFFITEVLKPSISHLCNLGTGEEIVL